MNSVESGTGDLPEDLSTELILAKVQELLNEALSQHRCGRMADAAGFLGQSCFCSFLGILFQRIGVDAVLDRLDVSPLRRRETFSKNGLLHALAAHGETKVVASLLRLRIIDVTAVNRRNETPLYCAAKNGHLDIVCILAHAMSPQAVNTANRLGWTPLHVAAWGGHSQVVSHLLTDLGADASAVDIKGMTPLHIAALHGRADIVPVLCKHGADASAVDIKGMTPLHIAALYGRVDIVPVLRKHGADPDAGTL